MCADANPKDYGERRQAHGHRCQSSRCRPVRIGARDPHTEHAAQRMRDDVSLRDLQMIEQCDGGCAPRVECRSAAGLEDLPSRSGRHTRGSRRHKRPDHRRPSSSMENCGMQQHHNAAVRLCRRPRPYRPSAPCSPSLLSGSMLTGRDKQNLQGRCRRGVRVRRARRVGAIGRRGGRPRSGGEIRRIR